MIESNWMNKSLEQLEKDYWAEPSFQSHVVKRCHQLRKKILSELDVEDLRLMISQNIGLKYLVPLAIQKLDDNILAEGDYYEGDLLNAVLNVKIDYRDVNRHIFQALKSIINENKDISKLKNNNLLNQFLIIEKRYKLF